MSEPKSVDSTLWWDSFSSLLTDLENAPLSSDLPPRLVSRVKENHQWFVETVSRFKPPNRKSKEALDSLELKIGSHNLTVKPELKDKALHISSYLHLDEVQSYIIVQRSHEDRDLAVDSVIEDSVDVALLHFYIERQCLLKCTRRILMHALYLGISTKEEDFVRSEAIKLISDGLERKLISVFQDLLSSTHPEQMDVDLFTLWAEETLIEDGLVLDILFLIYYESLCSCNGEMWRKLCSIYKGMLSGSYNFGKLAISTEALKSVYHVKVQLMLILIATLNLENLLQLVHDDIPFRQSASIFSVTDIQEMDALVSSINNFEMKETGPLILSWAVFLCLVLSLPGKEENDVLMEIDHVGYVRQTFEGSSLRCFADILESDMLRESDGHVAGYRSVLRTFISAFIASFEINLQSEDTTLYLILDILCKIYHGEESLCMQFWDRESFIDGPIRCLLCNLEGEFPLRSAELVRLLSSLCEGSWPAECVFNFLDKSVGISSLFKIAGETLVENNSEIVETHSPLPVPGVESLMIPVGTRGHVLKVLSGNTALVRWEYEQSGVVVLLLRLAHELYLESNKEVILTLDLLRRMVSFNTAVAFSLLDLGYKFYHQEGGMTGQIEKTFWVVEILCAVIKRLPFSAFGGVIMSMGVSILAQMMKCAPSHVAAICLKTNVFEVALNSSNLLDVDYNGSSSGSWLLSGKLARLLLVDSEHNAYDNSLAISVLDFTMQLVETRLENELVLALVVFSMQYILVNHEYWKYKVRHVRWKITVKVLELMKTCIMSAYSMEKLGKAFREILLNDSSIHNVLLRLICITKQTLENLYTSRFFDLIEIEGFQLAICSGLDILHIMLSNFSEDGSPNISVFHQVVMSSTTKPIPVVAAVMSLASYFRNPAIQVRATRLLSTLLMTADSLQPYSAARICFGLDEKQITDLRHSVECVLLELLDWNEDLFVATINLLTSLARYQPAYLVAVFASKEDTEVQLNNVTAMKKPANEASSGSEGSKKSTLTDALLQYVERSDDFFHSNPITLLVILDFLKALWQGAGLYMSILECLKSSTKFWKRLWNCISLVSSLKASPLEKLTDREAEALACKYRCQSTILEIMTHDIFLRKKLLHAESLSNGVPNSKQRTEHAAGKELLKSSNDCELMDIFSSLCERSILEDMIKLYTSCEYDSGISLHAKVATALFVVHVMGKLASGNAGSLSASLTEKIRIIYTNLTAQLAFSELLAQYLQRGYSEGKELKDLIINDLYYHLQGELEGRQIVPGPFKELSQYLMESDSFLANRQKYNEGLYTIAKDGIFYNIKHIHSDLGLDKWDYNGWKKSKAIAKTMLDCMELANSMALLENSKLSALKALIGILAMCKDSPLEKKATSALALPEQLHFSCIDHICQCFHTTIESLPTMRDASSEILDFLSAQAELLLHLMKSAQNSLPTSVCVNILKTSGYGLKLLSDFTLSISGVKRASEILLTVLLLAVEFSKTSDEESEQLAEVSIVCLGLLPILCSLVTTDEHSVLSLTAIDLVVRSFATPDTWFPIIQKNFQLQHVILKLQDKDSLSSVPIAFKFLLTLARVREGAKMLLNAGFLYSLRVLFTLTEVGPSSLIINDDSSLKSADRTEKPPNIWGLGLAVIAAIVHSLGDSSSCADIIENVITYLFSEKASTISYYLNAPDFPSDGRDKKRPRAQRTQTSLTSLKETEHTVMLMCTLAKHWSSWVKAMKDIDLQLGEKSIHLLAFVSRGLHRIGESPSKTVPLLCPPILKEEFESCQKPSILNSRNGWFALSPLCCLSKLKSSSTVSAATTALVIRNPSSETTNAVSPTYYSDLVALQIYKIAFLLLKFLCLEAEGAAKRSDEVGYLDHAHVPELPMPDILHGLQDQAIAIVSELCAANKHEQIHPQIQSVCLLLLHIMEMALYLELCVLRICGIRSVLGRVEDFAKEVKLLSKAMEGHAFLKSSAKSLKQIISLIYPGLLQTEGFF